MSFIETTFALIGNTATGGSWDLSAQAADNDDVIPTGAQSTDDVLTEPPPSALKPVDPTTVNEISTTAVPDQPATDSEAGMNPWLLIIPALILLPILAFLGFRFFAKPRRSKRTDVEGGEPRGQFKKVEQYDVNASNVDRQTFDKALDEFEEIEETKRDSVVAPPEVENEEVSLPATGTVRNGTTETVGAVLPASELDFSFDSEQAAEQGDQSRNEIKKTKIVKEAVAVTNDEFELNEELDDFENDDSEFDIDLSQHEVDGELNVQAASNRELEREIDQHENEGLGFEDSADDVSFSVAEEEEEIMNLEDDDSSAQFDFDLGEDEVDLDESGAAFDLEPDSPSEDEPSPAATETAKAPDSISESDEFADLFGGSDEEIPSASVAPVEEAIAADEDDDEFDFESDDVKLEEDDAAGQPAGEVASTEQAMDESEEFDFDLGEDEDSVSAKPAELDDVFESETPGIVADAASGLTEEAGDFVSSVASDATESVTDGVEAVGDSVGEFAEDAAEAVGEMGTAAKAATAGAAVAGAAATGGFLSKIFGFLRPKKKQVAEAVEETSEVVATDDGELDELVDEGVAAVTDAAQEDIEDNADAFVANFDNEGAGDIGESPVMEASKDDGDSAEFSFDDDGEDEPVATVEPNLNGSENETGLKLEDSEEFSFEDDEVVSNASMETVAEPSAPVEQMNEEVGSPAAQTVREDDAMSLGLDDSDDLGFSFDDEVDAVSEKPVSMDLEDEPLNLEDDEPLNLEESTDGAPIGLDYDEPLNIEESSKLVPDVSAELSNEDQSLDPEFASAPTIQEPDEELGDLDDDVTEAASQADESKDLDLGADGSETELISIETADDEFDMPDPDVVVSAATETLQDTGHTIESEKDQDFLEVDHELDVEAVSEEEVESELFDEVSETASRAIEARTQAEPHEELLAELESLKVANQSLVAEKSQLLAAQTDTDGLKSQLDELQSKLATVESEKVVAASELENLKSQLDANLSEKAGLLGELEEAKQALEESKSQGGGGLAAAAGVAGLVAGAASTADEVSEAEKQAADPDLLDRFEKRLKKEYRKRKEAEQFLAEAEEQRNEIARALRETRMELKSAQETEPLVEIPEETKSELEKYSNEVKQKAAEIESLNAAKDQLFAELEDTKTQSQSHADRVSELESLHQELEAQLEKERESIEKERQEFLAEKESHSASSTELESLKTKLAEAEAQVHAQNTEMAEHKSKLAELEEASNETVVEEFEAKLTEKETSLNAAESKLKEVNETLETVTKQVQELERDREEIKQESLQATNDKIQLEAANAELKARIDDLTKSFAEKERAVVAAEAQVSQLQAKAIEVSSVEALQSELDSKKQAVDRLKQELEAEKNASTQTAAEMFQGREEERQKLTSVLSELDSAKSELDSAKSELSEMRSKLEQQSATSNAPELESLKNELDSVREQFANEKSEKADAYRQIEAQRRSIAKLESEISTGNQAGGVEQQLREELRMQERRIMELEQEHNTVLEQVETLRKKASGPLQTAFDFDGPGSKSKKSKAGSSTKKTATKKAKKPTAKKATKATKKTTKKSSSTGKRSVRDDLTMINGIGPVLKDKLYRRKITTFEQIAAWTKDEALEWDAKLDGSRVVKDQWVKQAKALAKKKK